MKTLQSKFSVTLTDKEDQNKTFRVGIDEQGWVVIGSGPNADSPRVKISPSDSNDLIKAIQLVSKTELPISL